MKKWYFILSLAISKRVSKNPVLIRFFEKDIVKSIQIETPPSLYHLGMRQHFCFLEEEWLILILNFFLISGTEFGSSIHAEKCRQHSAYHKMIRSLRDHQLTVKAHFNYYSCKFDLTGSVPASTTHEPSQWRGGRIHGQCLLFSILWSVTLTFLQLWNGKMLPQTCNGTSVTGYSD